MKNPKSEIRNPKSHDFSLSGQRVTVLGWARSGRAAAALAADKGAKVFVSESRALEQSGSGTLPVSGEAPDDPVHLAELRTYEHEVGGHTGRALQADIIILSPGISPDIPILSDFRGKIWSEIELAYRVLHEQDHRTGKPAACRIVAVTGTNGKTTTTTLIGDILAKGYRAGSTFVAGNIGTAACSVAAVAKPEDICVLEISSFQLETIESFRPDIAVYLNLRSNHLDRYSSVEEYARAKERIFMNMTSPDIAVLNIDEPRLRQLAQNLSSMDIRTVSARGPADYVCTSAYDERLLAAVKAPENLLSAVAVADVLQIPRASTESALADFQGLAHRIERIGTIGGVTFYNDSKATNVFSVEAALKRVDAPVVLIMGGKDKGENYADLLSLVREKCRAVIAYGAAAARISSELAAERVEIVPLFDDAVRRAYQLADNGQIQNQESKIKNQKSNATVLLSPACSSYDQFTDYEARGERFRSLVHEFARERT